MRSGTWESSDMDRPQVVVVETDQNQRLLYEWELTDEGYEVASCGDVDELASVGADRTACLVLVDAGRCASAATERVRKVRKAFPQAAVVVHSASRSVASEKKPTMHSLPSIKILDVLISA